MPHVAPAVLITKQKLFRPKEEAGARTSAGVNHVARA
jgi:hypothetical protein